MKANAVAGPCRACGAHVAVGAGRSVLDESVGWTRECVSCTSVVKSDGLYPFQREGVEWLSGRRRALLADEMGLGKTVQAVCALPKTCSVMVVCKASLKFVWRDEVRKWRPHLTFSSLEPGQQNFRTPDRNEVVATSYESLPDWLEPVDVGEVDEKGRPVKSAPVPSHALPSIRQMRLIVDEAHACKNHKASRTKKVKTLSRLCSSTWLLTGTPLLGKPQDLFEVLNSAGLAWKTFGNWDRFIELFEGQRAYFGGYEFGTPKPEVYLLLKRVMLRRLRAEVLPQLPRKVYQDIDCGDLSDSAAREVEFLSGEANARMRDGKLPDFEQWSSVRKLIAYERIGLAREIADSHEEQGEPLVVFSAHRAPVDALGSRKDWSAITGDTPESDRAEIVRAFQDGALAGIALTISAGGVGLTLTRASRVLFVDLDPTPALNAQAEDRLVRIGQEAQSVHVMRMVSSHPVEKRIHELLKQKILLASRAIDGRSAA